MTTPKRNAWLKPSADCRIELRASRLLAAALVLLGLLGVPSWWSSDAPRVLAAPASLIGLAASVVLARRELARRPVAIRLSGDAPAFVDGREVEGFLADWRGPLMILAWKEGGRTVRRLAFPDAMEAQARRELRLWVLRRREDGPAAAVAP